jgi:hypothetical protein
MAVQEILPTKRRPRKREECSSTLWPPDLHQSSEKDDDSLQGAPDQFIGEPESNSVAKAHLISVIGGDTQIAGLAAAVANNDSFTVEAPAHAAFHVTLGAKAQCFRGSLHLEQQKRPLRHLIAVSEELSHIASGKNTERAI